MQRLKLQEKAAQHSGPQPDSYKDQAVASGEGVASGINSAALSTPIEQTIAETWASLLALPQVDVHSNFFSLGGHSLLAMQCLSLLRDKLPNYPFTFGFI